MSEVVHKPSEVQRSERASDASRTAHPAVSMVRTVLSLGSVSTVGRVAQIVQTYPAAQNEILALLHATAGNAFVVEVMKRVHGAKNGAAIDTSEAPASAQGDARSTSTNAAMLQDAAKVSGNASPEAAPHGALDTGSAPAMLDARTTALTDKQPTPGRTDPLKPGGGMSPTNARFGLEDFGWQGEVLGVAGRWATKKVLGDVVDDLIASIRDSPQYAPEVFAELWSQIQEHWPQFLSVTGSLFAAELLTGALLAMPDPTLLTKVAAIVLQAATIAFLIAAVSAEMDQIIQYADEWWTDVVAAKGDATKVAQASRAFAKLVYHVVLALLAVGGVARTARLGVRIPGGKPTPRSPAPHPTEAPGQVPESGHPVGQLGHTPTEPTAPKGITPEPTASKGHTPESEHATAPQNHPPAPEHGHHPPPHDTVGEVAPKSEHRKAPEPAPKSNAPGPAPPTPKGHAPESEHPAVVTDAVAREFAAKKTDVTNEAPGAAQDAWRKKLDLGVDQVRIQTEAEAIYIRTFEEEYVRLRGTGTPANQATRSARDAARKRTTAHVQGEAIKIAEARARSDVARVANADGVPDAFKSDPKMARDFADFNAGARGATAKKLAGELQDKTVAEMETLLKKSGGTRTPPHGFEKVVEGKSEYDQVSYTFADGTLVRIKPGGDKLNSHDPMYSVEMTTTTPIPGSNPQNLVAFKLDPTGKPVPKGSNDIANPYAPSQPTQRTAYEREILRLGHRLAKK